MAGRIPQSFIDELLARSDIVEIVGSRVQLKKAGREWKACCPFHNEKTPSFWVSPDKQFYHCFGCGAHGTALGFMIEHDRLAFPDAVEELASRLGLTVPREDDGRGPREKTGEEAYELMGAVAQFFRDCLRETPKAREYLENRGLTSDSIHKFAVGYAPNAWDAVLKRFGGNDDAVKQLAQVGLIIERSGDRAGGYYDRFRDRIMFPIRDARGRVIAFGGRVIDQGEPKYLNSPETPLFHKGRELYGLYEARQSLRQLDRLLVVEGYVDVVRLAQAGILYGVATLGTATTPEHLNRLFRLTSEVVFCFDGDRAGRTAAWRALENALPHAREGRQLRFLFLPECHDPDTLVAEEGKEAFELRVAGAMPLSEFVVRQLAAQVDIESVDGRARLAEVARPLVARVPEGVYRELLLDRLAQEVRMPAGRLTALLKLDEVAGDAPRGALGRNRQPRSEGRQPLLTQAIKLVLHHPPAALAVTDVNALRKVDIRGIEVLVELIEIARSHKDMRTMQLIERWRDRPEWTRLSELAAEGGLIDAAAAGKDLAKAIAKMVAEAGPGRRLDELIALHPTEEEETEAMQDHAGMRLTETAA